MPHRKLIRPNLSEVTEKAPHSRATTRRKASPPDQTNAENFYYLKQMGSRTPMIVLLSNGEELHGVIEWYDRNCVKVNRDGAPNLLIMKHAIKYMFKAEERGGSRTSQ
jgi:RNA chaperone Hfq